MYTPSETIFVVNLVQQVAKLDQNSFRINNENEKETER